MFSFHVIPFGLHPKLVFFINIPEQEWWVASSVRQPGNVVQTWFITTNDTRGVVNNRNKAVITQLCHGIKVNKVSTIIKNCSKLALLGSYTLWNARYSQDWNGGGYLKPWLKSNTFSHSDPHQPYSFPFCNLWSISFTTHDWCTATVLRGTIPWVRCDLCCFLWIQSYYSAVYWKWLHFVQ